MKQKYLALALSAIFATALAGCSSNDDDAPYLPPEPPVVDPDPEVDPTTPVDNDGDNAGNAAEGDLDLTANTTVGGQQYIRGVNANFDRVLNSSTADSGNETVINSKTLQNLTLNNIVLGRETVQRQAQNESVLRLAGEATNTTSELTQAQTLTLQEYNTGGGNRNTVVPQLDLNRAVPTAFTTQYYDIDGNAVAGVTYEFDATVAAGVGVNTTTTLIPTIYPLYDVNGAPILDTNSGNVPVYAVATISAPIAVTGNAIAVDNDVTTFTSSNDLQQRGLVNITNTGANNYQVWGQEDQTGQRANVTVDGSDKTTKIFGNKSQDTSNTAPTNSYRFTEALNADGVYEDITVANLGTYLDETKLSFVQYGRVTSNIDQLGVLETIGRDGTIYYQSVIDDAGTRSVDGDPDEVDTYFYRGTDETNLANMTAFFDNADNIAEGTVSYAGHAITYGIDNSYHGASDLPDTNAPGDAVVPEEGLGNFVQANVDIADRDITGSIFNVWNITDTDGSTIFVKDDLITFEGDINGNTAKGTSTLAYGDKDTGAFKGSFYGTTAQEFGGSVNAIDDDLYDKATWGGVFAAQKVTQAIVDGNANQTE